MVEAAVRLFRHRIHLRAVPTTRRLFTLRALITPFAVAVRAVEPRPGRPPKWVTETEAVAW